MRWALAAQVRREAVEMRGSGAAVLDVEPRGSERGRGVAGHAVGRDDHALRVGAETLDVPPAVNDDPAKFRLALADRGL